MAAAIRAAAKRFPKETGKALDIWARRTATEVKKTTPRGSTRNLRRSIRGRGGLQGGRAYAAIFAGMMYAPFVEFGTKAHIIRARNKKCLAYSYKAGTGTILKDIVRKGVVVGTRFGKSYDVFGIRCRRWVRHPGTKAADFFFPVIERNYPKIYPLLVKGAVRGTFGKVFNLIRA